jgi:hypothetical protein
LVAVILCFSSYFLPRKAQAAPPATLEVKPIFYESFDTLASIPAQGGTFKNIVLAKGRIGKGVLIQGNSRLVYPAENHFNFQKGTIEFWIKPIWDGRYDLHGKPKYLLTIIWGETQSLKVPVMAASPPGKILNYLMPQFDDRGTYDRRVQSREPYTIMTWRPETWHKVEIFWDFTLPKDLQKRNRSYVVAKVDDTYTHYKNVAPVAPEAMAADARIIIGQDKVSGRYPADAVIDELKIYAASLLPVAPFPEYQFNPFHPGTEVTFRKLFDNDGLCSNFETYHTQPVDCPKLSEDIKPGEKVLFFQRPAFEPVYENYVPLETEISPQLNYQAPKGEYETIFFNVYTRQDLNKVRVTYTDFQGSKGTIPKTNVDLRVVKNWFQAARGMGTVADQLPYYIPELLLDNDLIPLETDKTLSRFKIPSLPIQDYVTTKIGKYSSKQFAMIVKVPKDTPGGLYLSTLTLKAAGIPDQHLTLSLEVLPFALKDTGKIYSIYYGQDRFYADKMGLDLFKILKKDLSDIKQHGFNSIIFSAYNDAATYKPLSALEAQTKKIEIAHQLGFERVVIYTGTRPATLTQDLTPALTNVMVKHGFEPWFYGVDEMAIGHKIEEHINKSKLIHNIGGKVVTSTSKATADALNDPNNSVYRSFPPGTYEPLDWAIYPAWEKYQTDLMAGRARRNPKQLESFFWQCRDFQANRYLCGYFPYITGLDGPALHVYQCSGSSGQFYNDFDWTGPDRRYRPYKLAAPSVEGPVPTLQWEAAREGIKDGKYLSTWKYYKDQAAKKNPALARQSENTINNLLEHYKDKAPTYNPAAYRNSMAQYEIDRKTIIDEIKKLLATENQSE